MSLYFPIRNPVQFVSEVSENNERLYLCIFITSFVSVKFNFRTLSRLLFALIILGGMAFLVRLIWFKPDDINSFFLRFFVERLANDNSYLSEVRPPFLANFSGYDADFTPANTSYQSSQQALLTESLQTLETYPYAELEVRDQLSYDVMHAWLKREAEAGEFQDFVQPFNPLDGVHLRLPQQMIDFNPVQDREGSDDYLSRMRHLEDQFRVYSERARKRESGGQQLDLWSLDLSLRQVEAILALPIGDNPIYTAYAQKARQRIATDPTQLNELVASEYLGRIEEAWEEYCRPAYAGLKTLLQSQMASAPELKGLSQQPNGAAYYQWRVRCVAEYAGELDTLHHELNRQFSQLTDTLHRLLDQLGIPKSPVIGERLEIFAEASLPDSSWLAERTYLIDLRALSQLQSQYTSGLVNDLPVLPLTIRPMKILPLIETAGADYVMPSLDDTRSAWLQINPALMAVLPQEMTEVWIWKYGWPGQHFARSIAWNNESLSGYRQLLHFPAFRKGWERYSGDLVAQELLLLEANPRTKIAFYQDRLWALALAMADIDFHQGHLSLAEAAEWIEGETAMPSPLLTYGFQQIIFHPAAALAPFVGYQKIWKLRHQATTALGEQFFLQDFHEVLLQQGEIPLVVLEKLINSWIVKKLAG